MDALLIGLKILVPLAYAAAVLVYASLFFSPEESRFSAKAHGALLLSLGLHTALLVALKVASHWTLSLQTSGFRFAPSTSS